MLLKQQVNSQNVQSTQLSNFSKFSKSSKFSKILWIYDFQTCLKLFRFNMIWIVTIHKILKHVWTCSNMSKLVQIQYDMNCYNSCDSQICLNLFRFNMKQIVTIHVILKHVWTCWNMSELVQIIWYEFLPFMWFSNMSELVQIQYDTNCYGSCDSQTCLNMLKHI